MALAVAALAVPAGARGLVRSGLLRENHRGIAIAFPLGAVLVISTLIALAPLALLNERGGLDLLEPGLRRWLPYLLGIALLGMLDDGLGMGDREGTPRGWRGHAAAIARGELSTGTIKAIGALALAAYVVTGTGREWPGYLCDVLLLILTTNMFNLLDLRGGRVEKALAGLGLGLCLGGWTLFPIELLGVFAGPILIGAALTLRERAMLGDTGANLAGAVAGVWLLTGLDESGRWIALAVIAALTVYGEFRPISKAIESLPPLRALDSLGRAK